MMDIPISRVRKSLLNARVNLLFYMVTLALSYFSRRIFLQSLGASFVGFTGTVGNFLGFLNLAEMGTAMAVSFALYRPLLDGDRVKIAEIVSLTGFLYRRIGGIITVAGVVLSGFLPLIFPHPGFPMGVVYFAYYAFLASSLLSYYLNYGQVLPDADQRNYIVTAWLQTTTIVKIFVQMIVLARFNGGPYHWAGIELVAGIAQSVLLRRKIRQTYPYLHSSSQGGKALLRIYPEISRSIRQLAVHKVSEFAFVSTRDLLIYGFASLSMVAYFGNYVIVVTRLNQLLLTGLASLQAGIGNLIAENNTQKTMNIFWEVFALRYFTTGVFLFMVCQLIEPFIALWLGREYLLDRVILLLILANGFFVQTRDSVLSFIQGYGLFDDIAAPLAEAGVNLGLSVVLGSLYGLRGVLIGSLTGLFAIAFVWKPIYLFRRGFKKPVGMYWREMSKYLLLLLLSWWIGGRMAGFLRGPDPYRSYSHWLAYGVLVTGSYSVVLFVLLYPLRGMRCLVRRITQKFVRHQ